MTQHILLVSILAAFAVLSAIFGLALFTAERRAAKVRKRLGDMAETGETEERTLITRERKLSSIPALDRMLRGMPFGRYVDTLLMQADLRIHTASFLVLVICLTCVVAYIGATLTRFGVLGILLGLVAGGIPFIYVTWRKQRRIALFERQFPDALDLMTAALRAGLAFTAALQVVADESPDPISKEFRTVFDENRLGLDLRTAFSNLAGRVDSTELRLFVTAVLLQRETGGNLAEILEGTAFVIRDRFRILGDVRSITAQGRLSGLILSLLPIVMTGVLWVLAPDYMRVLITHPIGPYLIGATITLQVIGYLAIRKIVAIKV